MDFRHPGWKEAKMKIIQVDRICSGKRSEEFIVFGWQDGEYVKRVIGVDGLDTICNLRGARWIGFSCKACGRAVPEVDPIRNFANEVFCSEACAEKAVETGAEGWWQAFCSQADRRIGVRGRQLPMDLPEPEKGDVA